MRFNIYKEARVSLYIIAFIMSVFLLFYFFAAMFTSMGYKDLRNSKAADEALDNRQLIIIDAGHGGEDPGATANGLIEKDINFELASLLDELLNSCGYETVLTRKDDKLLYAEGQENKKKYYDLRNREEIAGKYSDAIFVSIHINKFSAEYCKGLQAFYSGNNDKSAELADSIQNSARILQTDNKRQTKCGDKTIYLLEHIKIPAVLVECGFISNNEEAELLKNSNYKVALSLSLYCGISEFTENINEN